jgi:hypothetical protein
VSGIFYGFLIHCKLDVHIWDVTFYLPEYLLNGSQYFFFGEMKNRTFLIWKLLMAGEGSNLMLLFSSGALSRCLESSYGQLGHSGTWVAVGPSWSERGLNIVVQLESSAIWDPVGCKNL